MLGGLQAVASGYKVSSSDSVQGVSKCLGDLAAADCTACLAQAVGRLKGTCSVALAADMHLVQCYVRYWASGYRPNDHSASKPRRDFCWRWRPAV